MTKSMKNKKVRIIFNEDYTLNDINEETGVEFIVYQFNNKEIIIRNIYTSGIKDMYESFYVSEDEKSSYMIALDFIKKYANVEYFK